MTTAVLHRRRTLGAVMAIAVLGLLGALAFDRWYAASLVAREGDRIRALASPYTKQIAGFFDRRMSRLDALRAFVEAEPAMQSLDADFPTFAEGLSSAANGVRAFQLVRNARIIRSWPTYDDSLLVGYNLLTHPNPEVVDGVRRAMATHVGVITGPITLLQGGEGLIVRQRLEPFGPDAPDMVVMVLDLESLISEAALASIPRSVAYALIDHKRRRLAGRDSLQSPIDIPILVGDVRWTLRMAPVNGWNAAIATELSTTRTASVLLWIMLVYLSMVVLGRQRELAEAVDARTLELETANVALRHEVEERRQLEERLLHSQKMEAVGTLAGGVAHDFNNLLTAIIGFAQLSEQHATQLEERAVASIDRAQLQELRDDLSEVLKAADRASLLTSQLLAFSRRQKVTLRLQDVNTTVHELERMLQRLLGERVTLVTDVSPTPLWVMADNGQLTQVLMNLVVNARDAFPSGGTVHVATRSLELAPGDDGQFRTLPDGDWAVIEVRDNGVGMPPEVLSRVFEPFFTTKGLGGGTGLGLSMVYGIVSQAGGQVFVRSALNEGTTVSVLLPRAAASTCHDIAAPVREHRAEGELVLVVEDEAGLRRLVGEILRRKGFRVEVAANGREALDLLDEMTVSPDLVLTDVVMPRMGGRELAAELLQRGVRSPVLFMSGYQDGEELPDDARYTCLAKPFTPDALVGKVRVALGAPV
ncbi:ATP-binding protein [Gemmatimonas sp.]|jgi:two-component system cell cycle sensor histidine kinase/response regulator CckA|uniref:ATP-binding protein n=1 Tax=Gemmatimonas sp. TaxID=1962908 RepID=UPI0037C1A6DB